ncbi:MAG TPA: hypothetical protein ENI87_13480 [bacterium]|nr:hypothetical protein [bacterium]
MQPARLSPWLDRMLGLCPIAIAVLWVAGVAEFRGESLDPVGWASLFAFGFALQLVMHRTYPKRPLPKLPEGARATRLSFLAAMIIGSLAGLIGGVVELFAQHWFPSETPWGLRTLWHAGCAFGAVYCLFLRRLLPVLPA